jgi:heptosyltransferase-2
MKNNNILVVGPAWVGDMVMAQCLFKLLKEKDPSTRIEVLAPAWSLPLLQRMPEVASAMVMPFGHGELNLALRYRLGKSLRLKNYSQAIVLPNSFKSALPIWFARIPKRTGWRGEMRYFLLNDLRKLDKTRYPLMIERFMALGLETDAPLPETYPLPALTINRSLQIQAQEKYHLTTEKPILALCPGAEFGPAKRWPVAHFATLANTKINEGWQVWIFGSKNDFAVAEEIKHLTEGRALNLAGQTMLEEAIDLMELATAVVSNDSGLMHIAAALNKPLVVVYGPTSSSFTPPLQPHAKTLSLNLRCQPCFKRTCPLQHQDCLMQLTPVQVLNELIQLVE